MATTSTFLKNASIRHAIFVQRFAGGELKKLLPLLQNVQRETLVALQTGAELTSFRRERLRRLYAHIDDLLKQSYSQIGVSVKEGLKEFAQYEADFNTRMYTKATTVEFAAPSTSLIEAAVFKSPMITLQARGVNIDGALSEFSRKKRKEIIGTIKQGVVAGKTNADIAKDITFVSEKIQKNHATALVRTIANHTSSAARESVLRENKDVIRGYQWVSTLDANTTETCISLDGQIFDLDEGPRPPIHFGCRSTIVPVVREEYSLKIDEQISRPAKGAEGREDVPFTSNYNSWLKTQSPEFQDEVLGAAKGRLFRDGGLSVSQFVDKNYKPLNLNQLKRKEPLAFEKAGLTKGD